MSRPVLSLIAAFLFAIVYGWISDISDGTKAPVAKAGQPPDFVTHYRDFTRLADPETRTIAAGWPE